MDDEALYRGHHLRSDARRSVVFIACSLLANAAFVPNDLRLVAPGLELHLLLAHHAVEILVSAVLIGVLLRSKSPRAHDRAIAVFLAVFIAGSTHTISTRPAGFTAYAYPHLLAVVAFYFALAGPVLLRSAAAAMVSFIVVFFVLRGTAGSAEKTTILLTHVLTNLIGIPVVRTIERVRREGFFAHLAEQRARAALAEKARELELAKERAETAARAKSDFLAMMSHELRTPMNAVLGLSEVLAGTPLSAAQRDLVRSIHGGARSLFVVMSDVLHLADLETARISGDQAPFAVREVVEGAAEIVRYQATYKGLAVDVAIDPEVPAGVAGDALRLRQMLAHLLSITAATTAEGKIVLRVSARALQGGEHEISFAVQGTGSALTVRAREAELPRAPERRSGTELIANRDLRVLVVDDNTLNREVALALLGRLGLSADVAGSGREALSAIEQKTYDVVLMDLRMPEMDGIETTRRIFASLPEQARPRVLAVSATLFEEDRAASRDAGMSGFIGKPLHLEELRAALERAAPVDVAPEVSRPAVAPPEPPPGRSPVRPRLDRDAIQLLRDLEASDAGFFARVCRRFVSDVEARLERLSSAASAGDTETAEREAHTLKTASATVGAWQMSAACAELESAARRKDLSGHAAAVEALRAELALVEQALSEEAGVPLRD